VDAEAASGVAVAVAAAGIGEALAAGAMGEAVSHYRQQMCINVVRFVLLPVVAPAPALSHGLGGETDAMRASLQGT
jgi:hypothetical protein